MENIGDIVRTTVPKNKTASTGKYSYRYVDIAQIHEYLESIGARYYQYIDRMDGDDYVMTVKIIDGKEGQPLRGCRVVDATLVGVSNPAQQQGSALTYARRYSLLMAFGLATDDDDAQSLSQKPVIIDRKATKAQVAKLAHHYTGDNLTKLLQVNGINSLEEMPEKKAQELINKIELKARGKNDTV